MQGGTLSQTLVDVFESDDLMSELAEQPDYRHYPIPNQKSLHQRPAHEGHNFLCGKVSAIQQARERQEHAKNEKKNKKGRTNNDNSIAHTSDLGSKARSSKQRLKKLEKEHLASEENKNKTNKPKKKDDDTKQKLDKTNKPKKKDDDIKQKLERNKDNFIKALYSGKKASTVPSVTKAPVPAKKERVQVENKACTPGDKKRPIVKKTPIEKKKVSFDDALSSATPAVTPVTPPCIVIAKKLQPQKQKFRIPKMEVKQAPSPHDVWRVGKFSTPTPKPKPENLLESPGTSSSESTTDKKDLKSDQERLKILCESTEYDPKVLKNMKKEAVDTEIIEQQADIEREQRKQYDKIYMDNYKKKRK